MQARSLLLRRTGAGAAIVGVVAALVLGILGMHALTLRANADGGPSSSATHASAGHADAALSGERQVAQAERSGATDSDPPEGHGLAHLCLAALAAAATLLALRGAGVLGARSAVSTVHAATTLLTGRSVVLRRGPPHVWAFSVIRC